MKFAYHLPLRGSRVRRASAVLLTVVFSWMMIQPSLAMSAQEPARVETENPDTTKTKNARKKKSKRNSSKAEDKQIILPPQIFATGAPQQPAITNARTPVIEQKSKPLTKPTGIKPTKIVGASYSASKRQIESAGQVNFATMAKQEALEPSH